MTTTTAEVLGQMFAAECIELGMAEEAANVVAALTEICAEMPVAELVNTANGTGSVAEVAKLVLKMRQAGRLA